ncbi:MULTISPECIES: NADH-quinone oxidoreductase subunit J [Pelosinus]|jgi:NADH-quinone oxidoreductase subunit J|uniref:NADH-quinone oxidoreductase subunit J n=1 Tax=Pelosinus fermentans B4 TaxID=1149862 RepID=I8RFH4_9FIRM|nr:MULTISPECIES: NADH-quinone oxidoreductase subunit J [Pelosinus]MDF2570416.1 NADH-ubiquinone/plastoquinone oxidoreductase chain 6 [Sporomusa sp.]EIW16420.1 NADH-ubiquinone/plastoquinone oxidoreductase chain 6 [Pelosinus fermentans B4]EIW22599.1 NADH-ubiquinone/plastoquinone oxidoreductase chain 6 [Pelosinus fermentans A11]OAM95727.1 NADH-ubiquinone/plastoquinone oxidoreductase chain 6 [Pelosinus fermentans DSM 17108]SDR32089.1 NADH-quinone oxidoreductase subunit J [Pelosinus fermentans]
MSEWGLTVAFYSLATITVASAIGVVRKSNLVHSALLLALCFVGVSGLYVLLHAEFLAAVQLLIYSGAVAVIMVLGIMLTQRSNMNDTNPSNDRSRWAVAICGMFTLVTLSVIATTPWHYSIAMTIEDSAPVIARVLLTEYMIAFEATAVLLLAAMVGAIVLAKGVEDK